jgi:uncharacterized protein (TIGR03067 family)
MRELSSSCALVFLVLGLICLLGGCRKSGQSNAGGSSTPAGRGVSSAGLDGTWKAVSIETDGQTAPKEATEGNPAVLEISGDKIAVKVGDRTFSQGTLRVDNGQQPPTIDINGLALAGRKAGQSGSSIGIYEVSGDTLKVCFTPAGGQRPKSFQTKPGSPGTLITYRRVH